MENGSTQVVTGFLFGLAGAAMLLFGVIFAIASIRHGLNAPAADMLSIGTALGLKAFGAAVILFGLRLVWIEGRRRFRRARPAAAR